jgi:thiamine pyrophosphate-dependent acetolactate synthase large subunit-like protein
MVALSMADGYARLTNKPQCVIVHVDVGTQGLGAAVHNASCGRAPVLIFAGLSPYTIEGEQRGSRTEFIHWIQDVPDQKQIVAQYCRYTGEIKTGRTVKVIGPSCRCVARLTREANGVQGAVVRHERSQRPRVPLWRQGGHGAGD